MRGKKLKGRVAEAILGASSLPRPSQAQAWKLKAQTCSYAAIRALSGSMLLSHANSRSVLVFV